MIPLTENQIKEINEKCPYDQGIFTQPYGVPIKEKGLVIYSRYNKEGKTGGSCWGHSPHRYENELPEDWMTVLDLVLEELAPEISYLTYRKIKTIIQNNEETTREYYGNESTYYIEYIVLEDLYKLINPLYGK